MLLVGLTGGLGAGKSTVAGMLAEKGAIVVDADELARQALEPGTRAFQQVCDLFGDEVVTPSGELDRSALAARVFGDEEARRTLESITHPEVFRMLAETVEAHRGTDDVVVFDAPLIIETGFQDTCDVLVVVAAPAEQQIERVARSRGMSEQQARSRIAAQMPADQREALANVVIRNDGDLDSLARHVATLWDELRRRGAARP